VDCASPPPKLSSLKTAASITPIAVYGHFDRCAFSVLEISKGQEVILAANCQYYDKDKHKPFIRNGRKCYRPGWMLNTVAPNAVARELLDNLNAQPSCIEAAIGVITETPDECIYLDDLFDLHLQDHHGNKRTNVHGDVRVSKAGRPKGTRFARYADLPHKFTGQRNCFKFEVIYEGLGACRKAGVAYPGDMEGYDFHQVVDSMDNLYAINRQQLGRAMWRKAHGIDRRRPWIIPIVGFQTDMDLKAGECWCRGSAQSERRMTQDLVDELKGGKNKIWLERVEVGLFIEKLHQQLEVIEFSGIGHRL
jgi:hypothetical protein